MFHWKQEINSEFSDSPLRLQYYIIITGAAYFLFAFLIPTMSAMRRWLGISTILTFTYIIILLVVLVKDGRYTLPLAYFVLERFSTMILHCGSFVTIYMLCLNINLLNFGQGNLTKTKIIRFMEVKQTRCSMALVQFQPLLFVTPLACYSKYRLL